MKKINSDKQGKTKKWVTPDDNWSQTYPQISQWTGDAYWDDGTSREVCTLTIRGGSGIASVSLNDKTENQSVTSSGATVHEALAALEAVLTSGSIPWRVWAGKRR